MDDHDDRAALIDLTGTAKGLQSPATGKQHMTSSGVKRTPPPYVWFGKQYGSPTDFSGISYSRYPLPPPATAAAFFNAIQY